MPHFKQATKLCLMPSALAILFACNSSTYLINNNPNVPHAPTEVTAVAGNTQVTVSWTAPDSDGGSPIIVYIVRSVQDTSKYCVSTFGTSCTVNGLTNGNSYTFIVTATNTNGTGPASSPSTPVKPLAGLPSAPYFVEGNAGNTQVTVTWIAADSNGSKITGYTAKAVQDSGKHCATTGSLTCTITGLTNDTAYTFIVTATNIIGTGAPSSPSRPVTPSGIPGLNWTVKYTGSANFSSVTWTGSLLVALGSGLDVYGDAYSTILTSPDCSTWTVRDSSKTIHLSSVTWTGSRVVAVGNNAILTSPNGIAWTARDTTTKNFQSVVWTGSQLIAYGFSDIATSSDGITWTMGNYPPITWLYSVVWTGSQFVAVGLNGGIVTSPNGITWTSRNSGTANTLYSVAWTGSQLVAVGDKGAIRTSSDGIAWTPRISGTTDYLRSVIWNGSLLLIPKYDSLLTSTDGATWTHRPSGTGTQPQSVIWMGNKLIGVSGTSFLTSP